MKKTYLITYDLSEREEKDKLEDYKKLDSFIEDTFNSARCLESAWIVETHLEAPQILEMFKGHIKTDDKFIICHLDKNIAYTESIFTKNNPLDNNPFILADLILSLQIP